MIILVSAMLAIGVLATLALGSACLIGQALVESQGCPELDGTDTFMPSLNAWQTAAVNAAR